MAFACKQCYWCAKHVGGINLWGNVMLLVVKLLGGIFGKSQALIADAIHSFSDVIIALFLIISLRVSAVPADKNHRWGHGNIESILSAIIGILLICAAVSITAVSLTSIVHGITYDPGIFAVWAAAISIFANEVMFRHSLCAGKQVGSPAMVANAWENRGDVYSSIAAMIGVFGAKMGFTFLDPVAAVAVGFLIARSGLKALSLGAEGMTDRSIDRGMLSRLKKLVSKEEEVRDVGRIRARKIGQNHWIDIEVKLGDEKLVSEAKQIVADLKKKVMDEFDGIGDVTIISRAAAPQLLEEAVS